MRESCQGEAAFGLGHRRSFCSFSQPLDRELIGGGIRPQVAIHQNFDHGPLVSGFSRWRSGLPSRIER